jgi:hypothetical protein
MPLERVAGKFAEDVWRVMGNRSKIVLATASVACAVLVWALARWFGIPAHPGYEMSLALQPSAALALIGTGIGVLAATALGTAIAGTVRFDAGLFAAAVGLAALSNRGGPMRYVLQAAPGRGVFVALAAELLLLGAMLGLAWFGLWLLYRRGRLLGDEMRDGLKDRPHSFGDRASAMAAQAGATAFLIVLLARTDDKKQVLAAVCLLLGRATRRRRCWLRGGVPDVEFDRPRGLEERPGWRIPRAAGAPPAAGLRKPRHRRRIGRVLDEPAVAAGQRAGE